jgi:glycosyltransferase involved in cell wall biosynthesis
VAIGQAVIAAIYGLFAFVGALNLLLMRRPRQTTPVPVAVLIPARNEEANLRELLPLVVGSDRQVFVFDDESTDGTRKVAHDLGATVILPDEPLPKGWTGKCRACHRLGQAAAEASSAQWWVFLDADTRPKAGFFEAVGVLARLAGPRRQVVTAFPHVLPGRGIEPLFLAWVGWVLLSTNPFGLVDRSGMGHNRFLNGQFSLWPASRYTEIWPHREVRAQVMEDVMIGRLLARLKVPVLTANLSGFLTVRMYETWRETLDGMSKNSYEVANSAVGTLAIAALFLGLAALWVAMGSLWWFGLGLLTLSGLLASLTARAPIWPMLLMPVVLTIGAVTMVRSLWWRKTGRTIWKGRIYEDA